MNGFASWVLSVIVVVVASAFCSAGLGADPTSAAVGPRQLFLDDHGIAKTRNLHRTMHPPEKKGAVIWPDQPWEVSLQTRCAAAWDVDEKIYKLWMITSTPTPGVGGATYAESKDGIDWTKPILSQYEYAGSLENNFINVGPVQLEWPDNAMENVVYDPYDPNPSRRYKGFLGAFDRQPIISPDGIHWTRLDVPKLPSQDESNLSYDRQTKSFIATFKTSGPHGRSHAIWTSKDFELWTNTNLLFHADDQDQLLARLNIAARLADPTLSKPIHNEPDDYNADIYNVGIFRYEGLTIAMPAVYYSTGKIPTGNTDGFHLIQLASSRDLRSWQRLGDRQPFIGPAPIGGPKNGQGGAYDLVQLLPPSAPVVRGDQLWFYYTGIKYRATPAKPDPDSGAIHLAVLRRDGFISLDAGEQPGTVVTKPLVVRGSKLHVNVDAEEGELKVDVLDDAGKLIAASEAVVGDKPRAVVQWKSGALTALEGQQISLRFSLRKASLYSYWMEN
jgi:hypothetical protein